MGFKSVRDRCHPGADRCVIVRYYRHLAMILPSRSQLIRDSSLTKTDLLEIST